jgi:hypothetical protein
MSNTKTVVYQNGTSLFSMLAILFIALKLLGIINWSWWYVTIPIWGPTLVVIGITIIIFLFVLIIALLSTLHDNNGK